MCFEGICEPDWQPFTVCWGDTPTAEQVRSEGMVSCDCNLVPEISNIHLVDDHWEYSFSCSVDWLPNTLKETATTEWPGVTDTTGIVYIEPPCEISFDAFYRTVRKPCHRPCVHLQPAAPHLYACKDHAFPMDLFTSLDGGCRIVDPDCFGPLQMTIDDSMVDYSATGDYPYTVICEGCIAENNEATGQISIREPCDLGGEYCNCETVTGKDP